MIRALTVYITALMAPLSGAAEELPESGRLVYSDDQVFTTVTPPSLRPNIIRIYKSGEENIFHFVPYAVPDWTYASKLKAEECSVRQPDDVVSLSIPITFYTETLIHEIKLEIARKKNIRYDEIDVFPPTDIGLTAYAYDVDDKPYLIANTIPPENFTHGSIVGLTNSGTPASVPTHARVTCAELASIVARKSIAVQFFTEGSKVTIDRFSMAAKSVLTADFFTDLQNEESRIDKSTVSTRSDGGGASINLGFFSVGGSKSSATTTKTRDVRRIVNRQWIEDKALEISTNITISEVCQSTECGSTDIKATVMKFFFAAAEEGRFAINYDAERAIAQFKEMSDIEIGKLAIDESLKSELNSAFNSDNAESFEYAGFKIDKKNKTISDTKSKIEWSLKGDDWVPISIDAYLIDIESVQRNVKTAYERTVYGISQRVAVKMGIWDVAAQPVVVSDTFSSLIPDKVLKDYWDQVYVYNAALAKDAMNRRSVGEPPQIPPEIKSYMPPERQPDVVYFNPHDEPLVVSVQIMDNGRTRDFVGPPCAFAIEVNGIIVSSKISSNAAIDFCQAFAVVPPNGTYRVHFKVPSVRSEWLSTWYLSWNENL